MIVEKYVYILCRYKSNHNDLCEPTETFGDVKDGDVPSHHFQKRSEDVGSDRFERLSYRKIASGEYF